MKEKFVIHWFRQDLRIFDNPSINTVFGYKVGYEVSQGVSLIWDFRQFYRDTGTGLEPVKQTTIETAFDF